MAGWTIRGALNVLRENPTVRGPIWLTGCERYVERHGRRMIRLMETVPHYANPLSPLSPVVRNAGYKGNVVIATWRTIEDAVSFYNEGESV